jgi:hypothetical protein
MRKVTFTLLLLGLAGLLCPLSGGATQRGDVKQLMAEKLKNSQGLLEGLALADYPKITRHAENLLQLSKMAEWMVRRTPRYEMHSNEFRRSAEAIVQKAKDKNIDGVALAYFDMTLSCVRCHQYVREVQDARLPNLPAPDLALDRQSPQELARP